MMLRFQDDGDVPGVARGGRLVESGGEATATLPSALLEIPGSAKKSKVVAKEKPRVRRLSCIHGSVWVPENDAGEHHG